MNLTAVYGLSGSQGNGVSVEVKHAIYDIFIV